MIWQDVVRELMKDLGFEACRTMPSVYYHKEMDVCVVAHVDDFLACGTKASLNELKGQLKDRFDCSGEVLGSEDDEVREVTFLGRKIAHTSEGLEWRGDSRQVEAFLKKANLSEAAGVDTPGVRHDMNEGSAPMVGEEATRHRSLVALANFVAQDRPDIGFATKDLSQTMARPHEGDEAGVKRLARYFRQYPVAVLKYEWQTDPGVVNGFSDSDWGGCEKTRRSTTGGILLHGRHLLGIWSRTQQTVSLSSCEAMPSESSASKDSGCATLSGTAGVLRQTCGYTPTPLRLSEFAADSAPASRNI